MIEAKTKAKVKAQSRWWLKLLAGVAVVGVLTAGYVYLLGSARTLPTGRLRVVAGENFWGDIAAQIGGDRVEVISIISDPSADPHLYESDARAAAAVAAARLVIVNGLGYDDFMTKLLSTGANGQRDVVTTAAAAGVSGGGGGAGANPHLWYDLGYVRKVAAAIEADLAAADPAGAAVYRENRQKFDDSLAPITETIDRIKSKYPGAPVAYTESVPAYLLNAAGLTVKTPAAFARAVADGVDPAPADVIAMNNLLSAKSVRVLLYNSQTTSPITQQARDLAKRSGVPVVGVSETLPRGEADYQSWQLDQAKAILNALGG